MFTIQTITKNKEAFTGETTQKAFEKQGFAFMTFFVSRNQIGVEIEGFCASTYYTIRKHWSFNKMNKNFVEKFIENAEGKEVLHFIIKALESGVVFLDTDDKTKNKLIRERVSLYSKAGQIAARKSGLSYCLTKEAEETIQPGILKSWIQNHKEQIELLNSL
jgi:hypothetical protein